MHQIAQGDSTFERALKLLKIPRVGVPPGRDIGVDALRGLSILLVVLGHAIANAENLLTAPTSNLKFILSNFLYTFHMPLFFLISGYVLFARRVRVGDRAVRLLLPFFAWIPVYWVVNRYVHHWPATLLTALKDNVLHPEVGLWFLPTLFLCSLLLVPVTHLEKIRSWMGEAWLAAVFVAVNLLPVKILGIMQVKYFFAFFALGYLGHKYRARIEQTDRKWLNLGLLGVSALFLVLFTVLYHYGRIHPYAFPISLYDLFKTPAAYVIRYSMAVLGILFSIAIIRALKSGRGRTALAWFGLVTLDIYVSHFLMLQITFGAGWLKILVSCVTGTFLPLALSFLVLRQWWVTGALFLGIRPRRSQDRKVHEETGPSGVAD